MCVSRFGSEWRSGMTLDRLRAEMSEAVQLPGVANIWTMPIINRIDMLTTGIRSELGVKIFGNDLATLEQLARDVADSLRRVPGAANVYPEPVTSGQYLNIRVDRTAASRHGLSVSNVQDVIAYAVGETPIGTTIEGRERYSIRVRYAPEFRASADAIGDTLVTTPAGAEIPLSSVGSITAARGPAMISSENGLLLATVLLNVQNRDVGGFVDDARVAVASEVRLPPGYFLSWSGRFENQQHARQRLLVVVPVAILLIFGLLWWTYHSALEAAHVLLAVPFALTGGVYLLWFLGYHVSVAVWVGFIALFGTAVQTGVVMVIYLEDAVARARMAHGMVLTRRQLREAVMAGALRRLRPKIMTVSTVVAGLMPIMWSTRVGAEVMKPIAVPVLGGMVSSLLHVLIVTPVLYLWLHERRLTADHATEPVASRATRSPRAAWLAVGAVAIIAIVAGGYLYQREGADTPPGAVIRTVESDGVEITLRSADGRLHQGRNTFVIEFRSTATRRLSEVGAVRGSGAMPMPGMAMSGALEVAATSAPGRYTAVAEFGMAGTWQFVIEWTSSGQSHRVAFGGAVQ